MVSVLSFAAAALVSSTVEPLILADRCDEMTACVEIRVADVCRVIGADRNRCATTYRKIYDVKTEKIVTDESIPDGRDTSYAFLANVGEDKESRRVIAYGYDGACGDEAVVAMLGWNQDGSVRLRTTTGSTVVHAPDLSEGFLVGRVLIDRSTGRILDTLYVEDDVARYYSFDFRSPTDIVYRTRARCVTAIRREGGDLSTIACGKTASDGYGIERDSGLSPAEPDDLEVVRPHWTAISGYPEEYLSMKRLREIAGTSVIVVDTVFPCT